MSRNPRRVKPERGPRVQVEALEDRCVPSVDMFVRDGTLFIIGDDTANDIRIVGTDDGVEASGDGVTETFRGITAVKVQAGDGDDQIVIDGRAGLLPAILVFGEIGNDKIQYAQRKAVLDSSESPPNPGQSFDGGVGYDTFTLQATDAADSIEIVGVPDRLIPDPEIRVTDIATGVVTFHGFVVGAEAITIEAGDGDDVFQIIDQLDDLGEPFEDGAPYDLDGGDGQNTLLIIGGMRADRFDIQPTTESGSFEVRATDIATDRLQAIITAENVQVTTIKGGDGDDVFNVNGRIGAALHVFGQGGDDGFGFPLAPTDGSGGGEIGGQDFTGGLGIDHLTVVGTDQDELFEVVGVPDRMIPDPEIRVTDLATGAVTFHGFVVGTEAITVEAGKGDDQIAIDNYRGGLGGIDLAIFGQGGANQASIGPAGGEGFKAEFDEFDILEVSEPSSPTFFKTLAVGPVSFQVDMTDIATGRLQAVITAEKVRATTIKGSDGEDEFRVFGPLPTALSLFGRGGDDVLLLDTFAGKEEVSDLFGFNTSMYGGEGHDTFMLRAPDSADLIEIVGVQDRSIPDPEIRVTDLATGMVTADIFTQEVEDVSLDARGGGDRVEVQWDDALMSGLTDIDTDLGEGNNSFLLDAPLGWQAAGGVQPCVGVSAGGGNDSAQFNFGGVVTAKPEIHIDLGGGANRFTLDAAAAWLPPPDDGMPRLQPSIEYHGGNQTDQVTMRFGGLVSAGLGIFVDLAGGNDTFLLNAVGWSVPAGIPAASVRVLGGAGQDQLLANFGRVGRGLAVELNGQDGNDMIAADLQLVDPGSGTVDINLLGGLGNDILGLAVLGTTDRARHHFRIDGGAGFDIGVGTNNVDIVNCEIVLRTR